MDKHLIFFIFYAHFVSCYLPPRESESRELKSLNGLWNFNVIPKHEGQLRFSTDWLKSMFKTTQKSKRNNSSYNVKKNMDSKHFKIDLEDGTKMPVPSSFNDVTTNKTIRDFVGWSWYQREFYVPKQWRNGEKRVFIHFGSVHYLAVVFVNEEPVGSHKGGHLPFTIEIPTESLAMKNSIVVFVNNELSRTTIPQGELTYPNDTSKYPKGYALYTHAFDYFDYAGINRPVTLYTTPQVYISSIQVTTNISNQNGIINYNITSSGDPKCTVKLYNKSDQLVAKSVGCLGNIVVNDAKLWWPAKMCDKTPGYLYSFEVFLESKGSDEDIYRMPVGIRTVTVMSNSLLINNVPVYLRGFGMHEDSDIRGRGFDYVTMSRDMNLVDWIGANAFRTSHYPYAEQTLDQADERGLLVILEAPACSLYNFSSELYFNHAAYLEEMIAVHSHRPSVIMWSLANEPVSNSNQSDYYFGNLTLKARQLDSTRPITFVTSQPVTEEKAAQHVDVICVNRYRGWYSDPGHTDLIQYQVTNEMTGWHDTYKKPVIVTEYGAGSIAGAHTLPESMWTEDYQSVTYIEHFKAFDKLREDGVLIGEMVWNFIDFNTPQEYIRPGRCSKGLFTRQREPKQAAHVLRQRHLSLAKCSNKTFYK